jgi:2'-5' RNA ligase
MRLFVAVDLSSEAIAEAARAAAEIRAKYPSAGFRWARVENMHLTVRFIGHVSEDTDALVAAMSGPVFEPPFAMTLAGCGAFPASGAVRVVWIGLGAGVPELTRLGGIMDDRLRPFGFEPEARPFSPHLTLARAQRAQGVPRGLRESLSRIRVRPAATEVRQAVLYRSHLSPRGARYEPLAAIPLGRGVPHVN